MRPRLPWLLLLTVVGCSGGSGPRSATDTATSASAGTPSTTAGTTPATGSWQTGPASRQVTLRGDYAPYEGDLLRLGTSAWFGATAYDDVWNEQQATVPAGGAVDLTFDAPFGDISPEEWLVWFVDVDGDGACTGADPAWSSPVAFSDTVVAQDHTAATDGSVCGLLWD